MLDSKSKSALRRRLLDWFDQQQRDLPWRKNKTPYRIWVSEIMLQQTQVATVIDYYIRFMERFPNVNSLATADQADVLKMWEGLGYYRRARQMHAAAQTVVEKHAGQCPAQFDEVLALPGIGRYTAGAILSIALDQRQPILEGNTIRLFARLMGMQDDPRTTANAKEQWKFSESLLPRKRAGDFNQALMELGSTVCKVSAPSCSCCPLKNNCVAYVKNLQKEIPVAARKMKYESIREAVVLIGRKNKYLVRQCGADERWTGLWDFPRYATHDTNPETALQQDVKEKTGLDVVVRPNGTPIKHAVTRFRITLDCYLAQHVAGRINKKLDASLSWKSLEEIGELPMSVTGRKIAKRISEPTNESC